MDIRTSLTIIFFISIAGILFSGYLSYKELFAQKCAIGGCGQTLAGIPVCVYGFIMYCLVFIIALLGIISN